MLIFVEWLPGSIKCQELVLPGKTTTWCSEKRCKYDKLTKSDNTKLIMPVKGTFTHDCINKPHFFFL